MKRKLKTGVTRGAGDPPFEWTVSYLESARHEAMKILSEEQYHHLADQFKELARHSNPSTSTILDLDSVEDFFELRDKGGPLHGLNMRVFFSIDRPDRRIVVLGVIKKENDGRTPLGDLIRMRIRKRRYEHHVRASRSEGRATRTRRTR